MGKNKHLKENLTNLLAIRGLNPTEFANQANIPRATVQKLLHGLTENPRNLTLNAIAKFFDISIENLLYDEALKQTSEIKLVPLLKRYEIEEWLNQKLGRSKNTGNYSKIAVSRKVSEKAFAVACNETGSAIFKSGSHLVFDPNIKPSDDSYVLIKLFDHDELLFRQISIDVGAIFVKPMLAQFKAASKVRAKDKIIATLVQVQTNFEEF